MKTKGGMCENDVLASRDVGSKACPSVLHPSSFMLRDRALMLSRARQFFRERDVMEVDCPALSTYASVDKYIDLMQVSCLGGRRFLHSSPEYGMKRLLAQGSGDIYQMSHVFRNGECGSKHNPEFMMVEWYRVGMPFEALIAETIDFARLFVGDISASSISYREAFRRYSGVDYLTSSDDELRQCLLDRHVVMAEEIQDQEREGLLNLLLALLIEPRLGDGELTALIDYPASQADLAQTRWQGDEQVAERFELYYKGFELANGYHELANAAEQRQRFQDDNALRRRIGKAEMPIDERFLQALELGLPDSCGVAVGFDRLMMLRRNTTCLSEVVPFHWENA